jgi:hypothetical protein
MNAHHRMNREDSATALSGAGKDALHALRVLAEATDAPAGDEQETPPLPERLREQWQETYGGTETAAPAPVTAGSGWLQRLAAFLRRPRVAWGAGLAAAAAAIALVAFPPGSEPAKPGEPIVTRGSSQGTPAMSGASPLIVVAPPDAAGPLLSELQRAFPSRSIERVDRAPPDARNAILIDTVARTIRRANAPPATSLAIDPLNSPASVVAAVEALDDPEPR